MVYVTDDLDIPDTELAFTTSRSGGPGGQNVNKVSTRVTLIWNVDESPSLSERQRLLLRERLAGRISREGMLRVASQKHRSQYANREAVLGRFVTLVGEALSESAPRRLTGVPASVERRRIRDKRRRGRLKRERSEDVDLDE